MNNNLIHKIISIWTVCILILPLSIQLLHALENHEHVICSSQYDQHIHNQEIDCDFNHFQKENSTLYYLAKKEVLTISFTDKSPRYFSSSNYKLQLYYHSTRGPPIIV